MTRSSDVFVELDDRVAIANRYGPNAILVSIHYNASPSHDPRGIETFFWRSDSYGLATRVQRHLIGETEMQNHGVTRRVLRLTHNPSVPCILCECGYLTNGADESLIGMEAFRQKVAQGIADGVLEQQEQGDTNIGSLPPIRTTTYSAPSHRPITGIPAGGGMAGHQQRWPFVAHDASPSYDEPRPRRAVTTDQSTTSDN